MLLAQSDLTIVISWGAVISFLGLILGYIGSIGILYWKFFGHTNNSDVHINKHVHIVEKGTCDIISESIKSSLDRVEKATEKVSEKMEENTKLLLEFVAK